MHFCEQVRLFSTAKPPSEVGMGRRARLLQSGGYEEGPPPPGFEEIQPANLWRVRSSQMAFTKWRCPPRVSEIIMMYMLHDD